MNLTGKALYDHLKETQGHDTIILSFSAGKDSIALWLELQNHFKVVPYYLYLIRDLEFIENALQYYESVFGTHIIRMPHPSLYRMLKNYVFQPPERVKIIQDAQLPDVSHDDISEFIREDWQLPTQTWVATGVRAADSPNRRATINKYGCTNPKRQMCYPIWDWSKDQIIEILKRYNVQLPVDYKIFGRSFDGLDLRFLYPMKQHLPKDYAKILEWFPLAELELKRYEYHLKEQNAQR